MEGGAAWPPWRVGGALRLDVWSGDGVAWLSALEARYEAWRAAPPRPDDAAPRIPRTIHQIWLGPAPLRDDLREFCDAWQTGHGGWEYRLWRDADAAELLGGPGAEAVSEAFELATNWGEKSDLLRYAILVRFGGVYIDVDFEPLRPLDGLLGALDARGVRLFAGFSNVGAVELNNGFLGAAPGHAAVAELERDAAAALRRRAACPRRRDRDRLGRLSRAAAPFLPADMAAAVGRTLDGATAAATIEETGPGLLTRLWCGAARGDKLCLPPEIFYPAPNTAQGGPRLAAYATPHSLACHHWASTWVGAPPPPAIGAAGPTAQPSAAQSAEAWDPGEGDAEAPVFVELD
ncbi:nucleotide-diphospho-sugar transferase [Pelagophyceae sp. CCMP2097]|nr:nucleotide-diphospho-sugar transferase [Pelagophyceae sp. CCMP2097]